MRSPRSRRPATGTCGSAIPPAFSGSTGCASSASIFRETIGCLRSMSGVSTRRLPEVCGSASRSAERVPQGGAADGVRGTRRTAGRFGKVLLPGSGRHPVGRHDKRSRAAARRTLAEGRPRARVYRGASQFAAGRQCGHALGHLPEQIALPAPWREELSRSGGAGAGRHACAGGVGKRRGLDVGQRGTAAGAQERKCQRANRSVGNKGSLRPRRQPVGCERRWPEAHWPAGRICGFVVVPREGLAGLIFRGSAYA